ncbi:MAG: type II toxin-antitoxin system VapB family antitoxin [Pseudomonadota bacterium]
MRTNIVIDDELMAEAQRLSGIGTKRETVEQALRLFVRLQRQASVRAQRGKLSWEGDLDDLRAAR